MSEDNTNVLVEMKTLSDKLEDLEAQMKEITLRLGRIHQKQAEADAKEITDRVGRLAHQLNTTTMDSSA